MFSLDGVYFENTFDILRGMPDVTLVRDHMDLTVFLPPVPWMAILSFFLTPLGPWYPHPGKR